MNLKICPICRSIYPNDYIECEHCNEELIDNEVYKNGMMSKKIIIKKNINRNIKPQRAQ